MAPGEPHDRKDGGLARAARGNWSLTRYHGLPGTRLARSQVTPAASGLTLLGVRAAGLRKPVRGRPVGEAGHAVPGGAVEAEGRSLGAAAAHVSLDRSCGTPLRGRR